MADHLEEHFGYLCDRAKLAHYAESISSLVHPQRVVLDLGCGSGVLGLMALRAGAAKVLFVEESPIIDVARRTVRNAGFGERAEFFQNNSFELTLDAKADIVICDHVGYFGFDYGILSLLADARQRFMSAGGTIIPESINLLVAPVDSEFCRAKVTRWKDGTVPDDFAWIGTSAANTKYSVELEAEALLAKPATLTVLTLGDSADPFLQWSVDFVCEHDGTLDGIAGFFDCRLHADVRMSNSPLANDRLDRPQAFFPLEEPVAVRAGENVRATIMARPADSVIAWIIELPESQQQYSHTTFNGMLLDKAGINRHLPDRVARLNKRGDARRTVLSYCDSERTVAMVEALVMRDHPNLMPSPSATQEFIRQVLAGDTGE